MHCVEDVGSACIHSIMLEVARSRRPPLPEIVLWIAASRSPSESQTSECSDLLSRSRATLVIVAQRQPGKLDEQSTVCHTRIDEETPCRFPLWRQLFVRCALGQTRGFCGYRGYSGPTQVLRKPYNPNPTTNSANPINPKPYEAKP